jgi:hypothetical protein
MLRKAYLIEHSRISAFSPMTRTMHRNRVRRLQGCTRSSAHLDLLDQTFT